MSWLTGGSRLTRSSGLSINGEPGENAAGAGVGPEERRLGSRVAGDYTTVGDGVQLALDDGEDLGSVDVVGRDTVGADVLGGLAGAAAARPPGRRSQLDNESVTNIAARDGALGVASSEESHELVSGDGRNLGGKEWQEDAAEHEWKLHDCGELAGSRVTVLVKSEFGSGTT